MTYNYSKKRVLITGGTKGIGLGICKRFLEAQANVITCARNEPSAEIKKELEKLKGKNSNFHFIQADIRDSNQINDLVSKIEKEFQGLDILINNAGGSPPVAAVDASPGFNEKIVSLNLLAPLNLAIAAQPLLEKSKGTIVNISSIGATKATPSASAYAAAKAGLNNMTKTLAVEWGPDIRVVGITAGLIATEDAHIFYGDEEGVKKVGETLAMKRMGTPDDIAGACLFLASKDASWISGTNIEVHGGGENPAYLSASTGEVAQG